MCIDGRYIANIHTAAVHIATQQLIFIGDRCCTANMCIEFRHIAHIHSTVASQITDQMELHIHIDLALCHFDLIGSGHMVLLADNHGVATSGNACKGEAFPPECLIGRLGSSLLD